MLHSLLLSDDSCYQEEAQATALPSARTLEYLIPGLVAEAGEVAGKYAKWHRDETRYADLKTDIQKELGDVLWFAAVLCEVMDVDLADVAHANIKKLQDRQARGVLRGSGDDR